MSSLTEPLEVIQTFVARGGEIDALMVPLKTEASLVHGLLPAMVGEKAPPHLP